MKKKNGFIATSLMYSFFAVFSMVALIIIATYTHYRVLINNINNNVLNELNTQIASKYTTLYNLVNNGDFEENSDWNYTNTTRIEKNVPYGSSYSGTYSARMPKTDSSFNQTFSIKDKVNVDNKYHKVYVAFRVFRNGPVNGTGTINLNASGTDNAVNGSSLIGGFSNWTLYSQILKVGVTDENDWTLSFNITGNTTNNYTYIDNVMVIDITSEYNGNTTPDTDMKNYLDTYLNYFNDSYVMTKYGNGSSIAEEEVPKPVCTYTKNQEFNFSYTGGEQTFTPKCSGYYKVELWGASGAGYNSTYYGGAGGYTSGVINLKKDNNYYLYVGGQGLFTSSIGTGSYNGGGNTPIEGYGTYFKYFGGGGATDMRIVDGIWNNSTSLASRIMVAAGGGAGGYSGSDGAGGYVTNSYVYTGIGGAAGGLKSFDNIATSPNSCGVISSVVGYATQTASIKTSNYSITLGKFGAGSMEQNTGSGSGYYGGPSMNCTYGGSGGSSYISGHNGCVAITAADNISPKSGCSDGTTDISCSYHYSGNTFSNTVMVDGRGYSWTTAVGASTGMPTHDGTSTMTGNAGNGYAKITYIGDTLN